MNRIRSLRYLLLPLLIAWLASASADGAAPAVGSEAPEFKLQDQNGKWHELKDYRGKWVALYFYPKDQTPGCTAQACEFRDNIFAFRDANAQILGISVDDVESHKKFSEKHGLPFPILADASKEHQEVRRAEDYLGRWNSPSANVPDRPPGKVVKHYADVDPKPIRRTSSPNPGALKEEELSFLFGRGRALADS